MSSNDTTIDDTDDEQTYEAVTFLEAPDADTQSLLFGRHEESTEAREPEELADGTIAYVRREYEPVSAVSLPEPMAAVEARAWIDAHRDHPGFEGFDWEAYDRRGLLGAVVETRAEYHQLLRGIVEQLDAVPVVSVQADEALGAVQGDLLDALEAAPPTLVDRTPDDDDGEEASQEAIEEALEEGEHGE